MKYFYFIIILFIYSCNTSDPQKNVTKSDSWNSKDSVFKEIAQYYCNCISADSAKWIKERNMNCIGDIYQKYSGELKKMGYDSLNEMKVIEEINSFIFSRVDDFCVYSYEYINGVEKNKAIFKGDLLTPEEEIDGEFRITIVLRNSNQTKILYSDTSLNLSFEKLKERRKTKNYTFGCEEFERNGIREYKVVYYYPFE